MTNYPRQAIDPASAQESREMEQRLNEAIERMVKNIRQGRRIAAVRSMYKGLIKSDPDSGDQSEEEEGEDQDY